MTGAGASEMRYQPIGIYGDFLTQQLKGAVEAVSVKGLSAAAAAGGWA